MSAYLLDGAQLIFLICCLPIAYLAAFGARSLLRILTLGQPESVSRTVLLVFRGAGAVVAIGGTIVVLASLVSRAFRG